MQTTQIKIRPRLMIVMAFAAVTIIAIDSVAQPKIAPRLNASPSMTEQQAIKMGRFAGSLYDNGDWARAFAAYEKAYMIHPFPKFILFMARCKEKMRKLLEAAALYKRVLEQPWTAAEKIKFAVTLGEASTELLELEKRIPTLRIMVQGADGHKVRITVNGVEYWATLLHIELDPGRHHIVVEWSDGNPLKVTEDLIEGEHKELPLILSRRSEPAVPQQPNESRVVKTHDNRDNAVLVAVGTGSALSLSMLIIGAVLSECANDTLTSTIGTSSCGMNREDARTAQSASTATIAGGVVGLIAVTPLVALAIGASSKRSAGAPNPPRAQIRPIITPSGVFLTGTF